MKNKRLLSALLAALMLVGPLASCASGDEPGETKDNAVTTAAREEDTEIADDLPDDLDYAGEEIVIISRDLEGWTRGEIAVDSLISEPVNDAVFERNKAVEQRLNIKINSLTEKTNDPTVVPNKVVTSVQAGTGEYDIMAGAAYTTFPHTLTGNFANLQGTEFLDLDKPYWTQGLNEAVSYDGMQFIATGSMLLSIYRFAFVTVFNKDLFTDANQPWLYDTVEEGKWTLDKQISLVPLFYKDDGDGVQEADSDIYGFISSTMIGVDPYWSSCQLDIIRKNSTGDLELILDTNKLHETTDKVLELYWGTDGGTYALAGYNKDSEQDDIRNMFAQGQGAMATLRIMALENSVMRDMEQEYGVIPMPKFDEQQDGYNTMLHDQFTVVTIPTTVTDDRLDMVSAVMEALGSSSYKIVKPAYYETTLRTKIAQDPQSALMMDIITEGIYIDLGIIYTDCGVHAGMRAMVVEKNNNTASRYKTVIKKTKNLLTGMVKKLDKLSGQQAS